ncbi:nuclear transport factor 2 family protein [Maribacter sp. PR1]|uniref:Nuclear transport factor 2 family protein n=1 Tax=Maribacter cobaltidurans TaxID=1178778 RepID=A0ABU7IYE2_9FLAO|nr:MULTISPECIES: nuclear transport factor 2 family protein [Maribacter]MDC6390621.1 nuclear transport factor 2 family protein [Maribacter sp. PR1]MEE1978012.1 nuclear transport factor 2 family protein [Maribacter cobaltidurans]
MNYKELEDRIALRKLIDDVSILADKKDFHNQVQLFTEDGISETFAEGTTILKLKGRNEMSKAFSEFLKKIDTVYHLNGQQIVTIDGDGASGTSYCMITLIGTENGKKIRTNIGAVYQDTYVRENNCWLISKRIGNFDWQEKIELG